MTSKAEFEDVEWTVVLEGPPSAGMIVITAAKGGSFSETWAMSKAYAEARSAHGSSELLDEIVSSKPKMDHTRYHTPAELRTQCLQHLSDAVRIVATKGTPEELAAYQGFVVALAGRIAEAHTEGGVAVSAPEFDAIGEIKVALGLTE